MRSHRRILITAAAIASVTCSALVLAGCSPSREIAGDVYIDYSGPLSDAVDACALESARGDRRDDERIPSSISLTDISTGMSPSTGAVQVYGVLRVSGAAGEESVQAYAWECTTDTGGEDPNIVSFELVDEG